MNTPETDAELIIMGRTECDHYVLAEFARKLERERDELRKQNAKLRKIAERAIDDFNGCKSHSLRAELERVKEGAK